MRVLMATSSGSGHYGPMLPFASACVRAGHEVQVAAPLSFATAVERSGHTYWPCDDVDAQTRARVSFVELAADLAPRAMLPGVLAAIDAWRPDLILREVGELGSHLAAELRGLPEVQVLIGLEKFNDLMIDIVVPLLSRAREWAGLPVATTAARVESVPAVSLLPLSYEEPRSGGPTPVRRYFDAHGAVGEPAPLPDWWGGSSDPLVYATFGSVSSALPRAVSAFRVVVEALALLPIRVLATIGDGGSPADWSGLPANVRVERWVPQADVLPHAAAMVCHGGMGTVLGGLSAGLPMVVVPQFADQPDNAARVVALGAGLQVGTVDAPVDPGQLVEAVQKVLGEAEFRQAAQRISAEIHALPPTDEAVPFFESLATTT